MFDFRIVSNLCRISTERSNANTNCDPFQHVRHSRFSGVSNSQSEMDNSYVASTSSGSNEHSSSPHSNSLQNGTNHINNSFRLVVPYSFTISCKVMWGRYYFPLPKFCHREDCPLQITRKYFHNINLFFNMKSALVSWCVSAWVERSSVCLDWHKLSVLYQRLAEYSVPKKTRNSSHTVSCFENLKMPFRAHPCSIHVESQLPYSIVIDLHVRV